MSEKIETRKNMGIPMHSLVIIGLSEESRYN